MKTLVFIASAVDTGIVDLVTGFHVGDFWPYMIHQLVTMAAGVMIYCFTCETAETPRPTE